MRACRMIRKSWLFFLLFSFVVTSCSPGPGLPPSTGGSTGQVIESKLSRAVPQVEQNDWNALAAGNHAFAASFYQQLRSQEGNLFFSPYSISLALAMTYGGARGDTASQMAEAMHFTLPGDRLHPAFNALDQYLASLEKPVGAIPAARGNEKGQAFMLRIANAIWGQVDFNFAQDYLNLLAQNYGAGLRGVDFARAPEPARQLINQWVSQQTEDKIKDLFPQGSIDSTTRLALVNAIYFKASWLYAFDPQSTRSEPFHLKDGGQVDLLMMNSELAATMYEKGDGFQAVGLPYLDQKTMMVVLLPDEGQFNAFETGLDASRLEGILKKLQGSKVNLTLPKFKVESSFSLNQTLSELGMPAAFDGGQADFSGMDGRRDLFISQVVHKAYVAVDETGTEAAAATGVAMALSAMPNMPEVKVDRPFLFLIYEHDSGTILFLGRVLNPGQ